MSISSHGFFNGVRGKPSERRKVTSSLSRRFCLAASRSGVGVEHGEFYFLLFCPLLLLFTTDRVS